jgi:hypothetical protein
MKLLFDQNLSPTGSGKSVVDLPNERDGRADRRGANVPTCLDCRALAS